MYAQGAQIGADWNHRSQQELNTSLARCNDKWYQSSGRMLKRSPGQEWAETLQACEGIIHFDAVLCRGPRHTQGSDEQGISHLQPSITTVALGSSGCSNCGSCIEGPAVFGQSPASHLPLLAPPPLHEPTIRAAQRPQTIDGLPPPPFIARCDDCLRGRWCERCNKFWDEHCYVSETKRTQLQQVEAAQSVTTGQQVPGGEGPAGADIKVYNGLCIEHCLVDEEMSGSGSGGMWG
ncbi:hypothetical protein LTS18_014680 [Coniosporium uncinatum]|uniref:Uncharacterized protein n=1 Tax=Coniosporium uncinatum TaxID=93489 RepID=A0ACC3DH17_9PEZI|nr:hypothetical protein LTS18_014680 [Coniosporium uncinatum]